MTQCEHAFAMDASDHQVRCTLCGDLDDEMQSFNMEEAAKEEKDEFDSSQVSFE